ncbi:MAG: dipeptidase [Planctomycetes bacterium]|jgi:membrane dipeptidase|nr:dipeptidase [Planctomycetota bacterium]
MLIVDGHQDIACALAESKRDFAAADPRYSLSLPGLRAGGVGIVLSTTFCAGESKKSYKGLTGRRQLDMYEDLARRFPEELAPVRRKSDLLKIPASGRTGFVVLMEGADPLPEPTALEEFHRRGARVLALAWNNRNPYACGLSGRTGITAKGRELLRAMKDLKMVLDLSHLNVRGFREALEAWDGPIAASHSNAKAVADVKRNLEDWQIRAIAERGGVIGLVFYCGFLVKHGEVKRMAKPEDLLRHADHIASVGGEACVALGTDFDGGFGPEDTVEGFSHVENLAKLPALFRKAGWKARAVEGLMGRNWLRVLEQAY